MSRERRLATAIVLNVTIVAVQLIAGVVAGSVGLLADNVADVAAMGLSLVAVRLARRPATPRRSFGWHRSTILAAQANAAAILVMTVLLAIEAVDRLRYPVPVDGGLVVVAAGLGLLANGAAAALLHGDHGHDLNMRSAMLHALGDAGASAGVLAAGLVIAVTGGYYRLDPAVSLAISLFIAWRALRLLGETADVLLESTPAGLDTGALTAAMAGVDGVESVHDLHVWSLSSDLRALAAHVVLDGHPTLEEAQVVGDRVRQRLTAGFAIAHATLELECEACADGDAEPCGVEGVGLGTPAEVSHHH
jgi:cobalt-zinc-cadmium efflux system protein